MASTPGRFVVSYEIITPDSAEVGEAESRGWTIPGGWLFDQADQDPHDPALRLDLRQVRGMIGAVEDQGRCWAEIDGDANYATGARTYRTVHPAGTITPSSYRRVTRILRGRG